MDALIDYLLERPKGLVLALKLKQLMVWLPLLYTWGLMDASNPSIFIWCELNWLMDA